MFSLFRKRLQKAHRLGLVIESASPAVAEPIFSKLPHVFPGVTFDLLTESRDPRHFFRNFHLATGHLGVLRLLLRLRKRYDLVVVCGAGEPRLRFARLCAFFLMRLHAPMFVFNEFAEGFWLDRARWPNIRSHLKMRHGGSKAPLLLRLSWKNLIGACGVIVVLPLIAFRAALLFLYGKLVRGLRLLKTKQRPAADAIPADDADAYQSLENQLGEISYRRDASFGEPEKAMGDVHTRIEARRGVFERMRTEGRLDGPFLEIGAGVSQTALMLRNEFAVDGAATDISLHALEAAEEIAARIGYSDLPLRVCCDARWLPFQDGVFPLAYCFQTLHHFADPGPILREIARVLRPGGHFYLAEEPVRRWLCLNLYRCERLEDLKGLDKWLFDVGLLRYIAEAYVGSKPETMWGIMENEGISMRQWDSMLSVFDDVNLDAPTLFTDDAILFRKGLAGLGFPPEKAERLAASLFGAVLSGLCRVRGSAPSPATPRDLRLLCRCPECHRPLLWQNGKPGASACFACPQCGPFPQENGVHMLFRRKQLEALYRSSATLDSSSPAARSPEARARKGRSPHPLVEGAQIGKVRLLNAQGDEVLRVRSGDETVLRVWIECSRPLSNPVIGLLIRRYEKGNPILLYGTNTLQQHRTTGNFSPGEMIEARFSQSMNLGQGSYEVTVAVASHDAAEFYDWQEGIFGFRVEESPTMHGIVNLHSEIEVAKRSVSAKPDRASPGAFALRLNGADPARVLNEDGSANPAASPARRGSVIQIFAAGVADTLPSWPPDQPAPSSGDPLLRTRVLPVVAIGGVPAPVLFSGLAPGFAGVLQLNVNVPLSVSPGSTVPVEVTANGVTHHVASIGVR